MKKIMKIKQHLYAKITNYCNKFLCDKLFFANKLTKYFMNNLKTECNFIDLKNVYIAIEAL